MILRRLKAHVEKENWFAVGVDFCIVVIGVFIGIQVANWNEARAANERERMLLVELRGEVKRNVADTEGKGRGFLVGAISARHLLERSDDIDNVCDQDCWDLIVDMMHASQWQQMNINWTTYDELRRDGLPSNREIVDAVESLQYVARQSANALVTPPEYRTLIRRKIPIELQDAYWDSCFLIEEQVEIYIDPCEKPDSVVVDPELVNSILSDEQIITTMREWTSIARMTGAALIESGQGHTEVLQILDKEISK
jgi:hypothetical protein